MKKINKHIIHYREPLITALKMLNEVGADLTLFVLNDQQELIGALTDGDIRRGLIKGIEISEPVESFMQRSVRYIKKYNYSVDEIDSAKKMGIQLLPIVDENKKIIRFINFADQYSYLPVDVLLMAGGEGIRLRPLTEKTPKPLLKIGDLPILEHGINHLMKFGIEKINISINYLGDKIIEYFGDGNSWGVQISYIKEEKKLGTIGALSLVDNFNSDFILILNSDLLTNIDLEAFFREFIKSGSDLSIASIPYVINIPYAILDTKDELVIGLKEKPTITYYSNAGIYLLKKQHVSTMKKGEYFNATDLIEELIKNNKKVTYFPLLDYWLDIGKMDDFKKAQEDIKYLKL